MKAPKALILLLMTATLATAYEPVSALERSQLKAITPTPGKILRTVIDSDTYNEVDDQFAIVYALLSPERLNLEAIYAAPFHNQRSNSAEEGMEKSYDEILRLLSKMGMEKENFVFRGSRNFLKAPDQPEPSPAVDDLIQKAMEGSPENPLYVVALGAITNVASAILKEPAIINNIVVVWLGGDAPGWSNRPEFNLRQDAFAAAIVLDSGVPFVQIPCVPVADHLLTTIPELETYVQGQGLIGDYLFEIVKSYSKGRYAFSKVIWDISAVAYLIDPKFTQMDIVHSPIIAPDKVVWSEDRSRHFTGMVKWLSRDWIFGDLFRKLEQFANSTPVE